MIIPPVSTTTTPSRTRRSSTMPASYCQRKCPLSSATTTPVSHQITTNDSPGRSTALPYAPPRLLTARAVSGSSSTIVCPPMSQSCNEYSTMPEYTVRFDAPVDNRTLRLPHELLEAGGRYKVDLRDGDVYLSGNANGLLYLSEVLIRLAKGGLVESF